MNKLTVGLFFGGRSTEHEVSVISAIQAYNHLDKSKYTVIPIYISKEGQFYTNPKFLDLKNYKDINRLLLSSKHVTLTSRNGKHGILTKGLFSEFMTTLDVAFPLFHGSFGEDGCIQGLFEMFQIPFVGLGVTGSSIAMDKVASKALFSQLGLPIGKFGFIRRIDWNQNPESSLKDIKKSFEFPLFIKPATGGSSIGANKAVDEDSLSFAIEVASVYSDKILIEEAFENCIEVNCSAIGYEEIRASVCEMPIPSGEILSYEDKYISGNSKGGKNAGMASLDRVIPAPIPHRLASQIQAATMSIFKALDGCGVARVDFFVDKKKEKFWVNEVNSPPGSLSFYLWEPTGVKYKDLLDQLIDDALKRAHDKSKTQYTFDSPLLSQMAHSGGIKGKKN